MNNLNNEGNGNGEADAILFNQVVNQQNQPEIEQHNHLTSKDIYEISKDLLPSFICVKIKK